jgi:hypothetical protein
MDLDNRYDVDSHGPFELGDCTFHHGWVLHSAPPNNSPSTRYAYTVSFVKDGARLLTGQNQVRAPDSEDGQSYREWIRDVGWGGVADHPLLPLVYTATTAHIVM